VRTFRLLLWLRWKLFLRTSSRGNRFANIAITLVMLLAFSPAWLGGAIAAFAGVRAAGAPAVLIAFGLCQIVWLWFGLLLGAMGRTFDLDTLIRHPVRPRTIFALNVVASVLSPIPLMTLPTLVAVVAGAGAHSGVPGALAAALGSVLLLLLTATIQQVLLALLDELLRRESVRYAATAVTTLMIVGFQLALQLTSRTLARQAVLRVARHEISLSDALASASHGFAFVPTIAGPAAVASGAFAGGAWLALAGLAVSLALLAAGILPGAALMRRSVLAARGDEGRGPRKRAASGGGSFAIGAGLLPRGVALMLARELRYTLRFPQRLMSVVLAPIVVIGYFLITRHQPEASTAFVFALLSTTIATSSMLQFGYDGPGVRSVFLLPMVPRQVLLAKNLELLLRIGLQVSLVGVALGVLQPGLWSMGTLTIAVASGAVVLVVLSIGTAMSIRQPSRVKRRGLQGRGASGWATLAVYLGMFGTAGVLAALIWGVRRLGGPSIADAAGMSVAVAAVLVAALVWWRSLELCARMLPQYRERMIDAIAKGDDN
jgi:hypothetical protein